jgi:hypothetical protein
MKTLKPEGRIKDEDNEDRPPDLLSKEIDYLH